MKVDREQRPAGPEFLLVIKRYFFKDEAATLMTSLGLDSSQAACLEELLILDSVHEVVKVVGNRDKWSPRRGTRLLGN